MAGAALLTPLLHAAPRAQAPGSGQSAIAGAGAGDALKPLGDWTESPAHVRLFAPPAHQAAYRAFVSPVALDEVLRRIAAIQPGPPGAWRPDDVSPLDAFGSSGSYNLFQLVRSYLRNRPRTAHGPWATDEGLETWTLVSPYPTAGLDAVEPGTLLLAMRVPPL